MLPLKELVGIIKCVGEVILCFSSSLNNGGRFALLHSHSTWLWCLCNLFASWKAAKHWSQWYLSSISVFFLHKLC